jgi:hypothetical protein
LLHERAILVTGAEIDIDTPDLVTLEGEELGVAKALAALGHTPVGHKGPFSFVKDSFQFLPLDPVADAPAPREIGRLVDLVIIGTGEAEIPGKRILDSRAVVRQIGGKKRG